MILDMLAFTNIDLPYEICLPQDLSIKKLPLKQVVQKSGLTRLCLTKHYDFEFIFKELHQFISVLLFKLKLFLRREWHRFLDNIRIAKRIDFPK